MKKILRTIGAITLCLLMAASFTGCNLGDDEEQDVSNREIQIKVSILNTASEKAAMSAFRRAFHAAQDKIGIKVEYLQGGTQYLSGIITDYTADNLADIVWTSGDQHSSLSSSGVFMNLSEFLQKEDESYLDDFYPAITESARLKDGGKNDLYFMPRDYNKVVVAYNRDMLTAAGVDFPADDWTWSDFISKARAVREKMDANANPRAGLLKNNLPIDGLLSWQPLAYTMLRGFGGDVYKDGEYEHAFTQNGDSSKSKAYFEEVKMLAVDRLSGIDTHDGSGLFAAHSAAFAFLSRPTVAEFASMGVNFDFVPFPRMENDAVGVGCVGYAISAKSEHKQEAWEFLKFIASKEGQEAFALTGAGVPVRKSLANSDTWVEWKAEYMDYTPNNKAFTMYPENDISVNYFSELDVKLHTEAVAKFKLAVQDAEEWTETRGWGGGGASYESWFASTENTIKSAFDSLLS